MDLRGFHFQDLQNSPVCHSPSPSTIEYSPFRLLYTLIDGYLPFDVESLTLRFESPRSRENRRLPLPTRTLLSSLTHFTFKGVSEYLEDILAWVDPPLLDHLDIIFFRELILYTPQLAQFIGLLKLSAHDQAHLAFSNCAIMTLTMKFPRSTRILPVRVPSFATSSLHFDSDTATPNRANAVVRSVSWSITEPRSFLFSSSLPHLRDPTAT